MADTNSINDVAKGVYSELQDWEYKPWSWHERSSGKSADSGPCRKSSLLSTVADDASALASIWSAVIRRFIDGRLRLSDESLRDLCQEYELSPTPNAPVFARLRAFSEYILTKPVLGSILEPTQVQALSEALYSLMWVRDSASEQLAILTRSGLASGSRSDWDVVLKKISSQIEKLEESAARLHAIAAEVGLMASTRSAVQILFLAANPISSERISLDEEHRAISQKIQMSPYRDFLELRVALAVRPIDLQEALLQYVPSVVHFSGHGTSGGLVLHSDNPHEMKLASAGALEDLFSTLSDNIRIVLLNACYSEDQAKAISKHVDFVIGMNHTIGDRAARLFSASFYLGLGYGKSIVTAFKLGINALKLDGHDYENVPELLIRDGANPYISLQNSQ